MKKLLMVIDYQVDFVSGALGFPGAEKLDAGIAGLIDCRRAEGYDILFTLDTHGADYLNTAAGRGLPIPHCIEGTEGHALYGLTAKARRPEDTVLCKPTFGCARLLDLLRERPYDVIELCGLVSNICVLSNAVVAKTACPEAEITVFSDLTASSDPSLNEAALALLRGLLIQVKEYDR